MTSERKKIGLFESGELHSVGFPECCKSSIFQVELFRPASDTSSGYVRLIFDDLDLPPGSRLKVSPFDSSTLVHGGMSATVCVLTELIMSERVLELLDVANGILLYS